MMTTECQSKNMTSITSEEERAKARAKRLAVVGDDLHKTPAVSSALQLKVEPAFQIFKLAMRYYCFVKGSFQ